MEGLASKPGPFGLAAPEAAAADFFPAGAGLHPQKTKTALLGHSHPRPGLFQRLRSHVELLVLITNSDIPYCPRELEQEFADSGRRWLCGAVLPIMESYALINAPATDLG